MHAIATALLLLLTMSAWAGPPPPLDIMVEDAAPPFSYADGSGYANEVVIAALRAAGVQFKLRVVPRATCLSSVLEGQVAACFSMDWLPEYQDLIVLAEPPLVVLDADLYEHRGRPLPRPEHGCSLPAGTRVAIADGQDYPAETLELARSGALFEASPSHERSLRMLAAGRVDAAMVINNELLPREQLAAQVGKELGFVFRCGRLTASIGFSLKHPRGRWAHESYLAGYKRIEAQGLLAQIRQRWAEKLAAAR
ncbi:substrate-binding periplasmic protein [Paucibacter soli]|uniref:substrate-binding periplasmic protein n=1 Tax=Paucibacter soli TaxID=3133433 RepID=UPI0030988D72